MTGRRTTWLPLVALALWAGCSAERVERGVFHAATGYRVSVPRDGWTVVADSAAHLELRRAEPPGGMVVSATCDGAASGRSLPLLARHLTFGLAGRRTVERGPARVAGAPAERLVLRGRLDGVDVMVEAVVARDDRCVYDFLYVAPPGDFAAGQPAFRALVESFAPGGEP